MSIFDTNIAEECDWVITIQNSEKQNPLLNGHPSKDYHMLFNVYFQIRSLYQKFFSENWLLDAETASKNVNDRFGEIGESRDYHFSVEEFENLKDYIAKLQVPDSFNSMIEFVRRVAKGDLEFLCIYPIDGKTAKEQFSTLPQEWIFNRNK